MRAPAFFGNRPAIIPVSDGLRTALAAPPASYGEMFWPAGSEDRLLNVDRQATVFVAPTSFGPAAYLESDTAVSLSRISPDCGGDAIEDPSTFLSRQWLSAVEPAVPSRRLAASAINPFAVSLSADFRSAPLRATETSGRLVFRDFGNSLRSASPTTPTEPPAYRSTTSLYSRERSGVFLVGGEDSAGNSISEVWFVDLDGISARVDDGSLALGRVLAATYSFDDTRVWIIDETAGSSARGAAPLRVRLLTVDTAGRMEVLYSTRRSLDRVTPFLSVDRDGSILLALAREKRFTLHRISSAPCPTLRRLRGGTGKLVRTPIVDARGYGFVFAGENESLRVERRPVEASDDDDDDDRGRCWPRGRRADECRERRCGSRETSRWRREDDERVFGGLF